MKFKDFDFFFQLLSTSFCKLANISTQSGVPHHAALGLAGEVGADLDDAMLLAMSQTY